MVDIVDKENVLDKECEHKKELEQQMCCVHSVGQEKETEKKQK